MNELNIALGADGITPVITLTIENTGSVDGSEVVQVYIGPTKSLQATSAVGRPIKELCGFLKVHLIAKQLETVSICLDRCAGAFWEEGDETWMLEQGEYQVLVGTSSRDEDIVLRGKWVVPYTRRWKGL